MRETIGKRIRTYAAEEFNWKGGELAHQIGVSYETLRKWTTGEIAPTRNRLGVICSVLKVTPEWVMHGTGPAKPGDTPAILEPSIEAAVRDDTELNAAVRYMANALAASDDLTRSAVAPLLHKLATAPEEADRISSMLDALLGAAAHAGEVFKRVGVRERAPVEADIGGALPRAPGGVERRVHHEPVSVERRQHLHVYTQTDDARPIAGSNRPSRSRASSTHERHPHKRVPKS